MMANVSYPVINLEQTGRNIERRRRDAGKSVRELQAYFGFEYPQAIYKWQHGECLPTVDNLLALARILDVRMEDLLVYEDREVVFFHRVIPVTSDHGMPRKKGFLQASCAYRSMCTLTGEKSLCYTSLG